MRQQYLLKLLIAAFSIQFAFPLAVSASDYSKAVSLYNRKRFKQALTLFQSSEEEGVQPARASYYVALCYHQLNDSESAKTAYLKVIKRYPKSNVAKNAFLALSKLDPALVSAKRSKKSAARTYSASEVSVNYKHLNGSNHIMITAHINDKPTRMMLDTGAALTVCRQSFLDENKIAVKNARPSIRLSGVGGEVATKEALVNITIGRMTRTVPLMIEQDQAKKSSSISKFLGIPILGQNYFKDMILRINDRNRILTLKRLPDDIVSNRKKSGKKSVNAAYEVPFFREENKIIVTPKINGRECEMIFDTGADTVVFADRHLSQYGLSRPTEAQSAKSGGVGGVKDGYSFTLSKMILGPVIKKNVDCTLVLHSRFSRPLLGQSFLKGLIYTIDPSRNVIIFDRSNRNEY